jgi:hypothetical protein
VTASSRPSRLTARSSKTPHHSTGRSDDVEPADAPRHRAALSALRRGLGSNGVAFDSVRCKSAENVAVFRPSILASASGKPHVLQGLHIRVEWDGCRMSRYIVMGDANWTTI